MHRASLTIAALLLFTLAAHAQTPCDDALREAEKSYELGLFEDVPAQLAPCLDARLTRATAIRVRTLLARAYLQNEEIEKARKEVSTILRLDSTFEAGSSPRFAALVAQVRREEQTTQVASVSKTSESLREAPATVVVLTADEIQRRGYLDLEQLLHDIGGFDISRLNGDIYSYVYQRGYRAVGNDRLLLLVDGIEQNDLSTNTAYISRQYPLTNIDRVEVVYGPASTMYGANAYTGVVSIVTKDAETLVEENHGFGAAAQITAGGYDARFVDLTLSGRDRSGTVAWSIAGNFQQAKERDLSGTEFWDYTYRDHDYKGRMRLPGTPQEREALCGTPSPYIHCADDGIELTDEGEALVRRLDQQLVQEQGLGFDDRAKNWAVYGKLRISNLTLGLETWRSQEGIVSSVRATNIAGHTTWTPTGTALYLKYSLPLELVRLNVFTRYVQSSQDRAATEYDYLHNYAGGFLSLWSLVEPCVAPGDFLPVSCAPASPWLEQVHFSSLSSQLRSELNVSYASHERLSAVAGVELAKSSIQTTWQQTATGPGALISPDAVNPEQVEHTDLAVYAQGSYKASPNLKLVLAGRLSYNEINNKPDAEGYGTLFTPRAGVIWSLFNKELVLKAIYAEAFKDPTDSQKFGTLRFFNDYPSGGLDPETVKNLELSANWEPSRAFSTELSLYQARYANVVSFGIFPGCTAEFGCLQYQNRDSVRVRGVQWYGRWRHRLFDLWGNYTHTDSVQVDPTDLLGDPLVDPSGNRITELKTADIAANRLNIGADTSLFDRFRAGVRMRYVGARRTGPGTTQPDSPFTQMDPHILADAVLTYRHASYLPAIQLIVNNVFDKQYYDPTVAVQLGAPRVLQAGRTVYLRLVYGLSFGRGEMNRR